MRGVAANVNCGILREEGTWRRIVAGALQDEALRSEQPSEPRATKYLSKIRAKLYFNESDYSSVLYDG